MTLWSAGPVLRITFVQYLIAFCSRLEATSDLISGRFVGTLIPNNRVKFGDPLARTFLEKFNRKPSESAFSTDFRGSFRPEVVSDVISGRIVDPTSVKLHIKFGDSMSNFSRLPHFVTNTENDNDDADRRTI